MNMINPSISKTQPKMLDFYGTNSRHLIICGMIIPVILLASFFSYAFGLSDDTELKQSLKKVSKTKLGSYHLYFYKYCQSANSDAIGFPTDGNIESVPILISQNIKSGECQTHGTKIYTDESGFAKAKLFSERFACAD